MISSFWRPARAQSVPIYPMLTASVFSRFVLLRILFKINEIISSKMPRSAVVIGGGFVGVEMAENLSRRGINVTLIERQPQLLGQLDADMASFVHAHMKSQGVRLLCSRTVSGFEEKIGGADGIKVLIENEQPVLTDMVILAIGVTPDSALAEKAGLKLGFKNSIAVNEYMQTSDEDIYAVGDAVEITNTVTGEKTTVPLGTRKQTGQDCS